MKIPFQLLFIFFFLNACSKSDSDLCTALIDGEIQMVILDQMPTTVGGEGMPWDTLTADLKYPAEARENGIEGTVEIEYAISESGILQELSIKKDIGGGCGAACLDYLKPLDGLTLFNPGIYRGEAVKVYKVLPILFKLE